jgi:hypothetical protein
VRHPLVTRVVRAYEKVERRRSGNAKQFRTQNVDDSPVKDDDSTGS